MIVKIKYTMNWKGFIEVRKLYSILIMELVNYECELLVLWFVVLKCNMLLHLLWKCYSITLSEVLVLDLHFIVVLGEIVLVVVWKLYKTSVRIKYSVMFSWSKINKMLFCDLNLFQLWVGNFLYASILNFLIFFCVSQYCVLILWPVHKKFIYLLR